MQFKAVTQFEQASCDCLVVGVFEQGVMPAFSAQIDNLTQGYLTELIEQGDLTGKVGQTHLLYRLPHLTTPRLLVVGLGEQGKLSERQFKQIITTIQQTLSNVTSVKNVGFALADLEMTARTTYWTSRFCVETWLDVAYQYDEFKSQKAEPSHIEQVLLLNGNEQAILHAQAVAFGVKNAKNVANCPPNVCNPRYLAQLAEKMACDYPNVKTSVISEQEMEKLGMHAYLAVSRGSANPAFLSVIEYRNHPDPNAKPIVLVGKGLTFDSGGISIKPSEAMDEMKYDMGGAASVYGTMLALAQLQLPLNVVGVLAGCENMPDGNAYRPGDILTTMSGKTVEVLNTDAEGRLVLCDTLTYVKRFEPACVVDIATLTGACMIALGSHNSGLVSSDDKVAEQLLNAAQQADDKAWRLPMGEEYQEQLKSNFADLANIGGRLGGAITAGVFLSNFADYPWAHLDIAGTAWKSGASKGATGRPVPLLTQFLLNQVA